MKKLSIYTILMLFLLIGCKNENELKNASKPMTLGALTISNEHPKPGETLDITYKNIGETEAFYVYLVGENNYPMDIDFKSDTNEQKSSIKIPDSAVALAFIFKTDDKYDDNDKKGYIIPLYSDDDAQIAGSNTAMAYYANTYGPNYGMRVDTDAVLTAMKSDLDANPELKTDWQEAYLNVSYKKDKEQGASLIDAYLASLSSKSDKTEKEYTSMMRYYGMTNREDKSDSIKVIALQKYPKGNTANMEMVNNFQMESDLPKMEAILNSYAEANPKLDDIGNYMAGSVASSYFVKGDMANFEKYSAMVNDASRASSYNNLAWELGEKGEKLDEAEKMSKASLDIIESIRKNPIDKPDYYTQKQYEKSLESTYKNNADTYALILFKQGKVKEAIKYQEIAFNAKAQDDHANSRYIEFLIADNQYEKAAKKAEEFIETGHANDKLKKDFKTVYLKASPNANDFDDKIKSLEAAAEQNAMADVKKSMLDEAAPPFALKDMDGKEVSLASLKGKTVILDFWATWCGPCKASFPGMQQVVTKYKDDETVKLLFVDTFESGADREKNVTDFIKKNNYTFQVIYDSEDSAMAEQYGITGIPTKVIIGPDGKMRFKSVGYNGSNEKLVKEMDMMIAALK